MNENPDSPGTKFKLFREVHRYADTDQDREAMHHTIGEGAFQAASGKDVRVLEELLDNVRFRTGDVKMSLKSTIDAGWLELNGQEVSREDYAALFSVFGTTYGAGDGSTTFELPDFDSRFPMGQGGGVIGAVGGSTTDTAQTTTMLEGPVTNTGSGTLSRPSITHTHNVTVNTVPPYMRIKFLVKT